MKRPRGTLSILVASLGIWVNRVPIGNRLVNLALGSSGCSDLTPEASVGLSGCGPVTAHH